MGHSRGPILFHFGRIDTNNGQTPEEDRKMNKIETLCYDNRPEENEYSDCVVGAESGIVWYRFPSRGDCSLFIQGWNTAIYKMTMGGD